jgi:hypothetical protein
VGRHKKEKNSPNDTPRISDYEREEANKVFTELAPSFKKDAIPVELDATVKGLENLADKLSETGKKILNVVLTDFAPENPIEAEKDVFKRLRNACGRAGMLDSKGDQITFFKTIADPDFMQIVKTTGQGIVGLYIVPVVAKVIQQALEGDKTSQRWVLEITGVIESKYQFYMNRYALTHSTTNVGNINFEGVPDEELSQIVASFSDAGEAEEVTCSN